jgi:hypothetical protein
MVYLISNVNDPEKFAKNETFYINAMFHTKALHDAKYLQDITKLVSVAGISTSPLNMIYGQIKALVTRFEKIADTSLLKALKSSENLEHFINNNIKNQKLPSRNIISEASKDTGAKKMLEILDNAGIGKASLLGISSMPLTQSRPKTIPLGTKGK